jgi:mRNA (2'-O-methyladenosine-N6-)-methyltransferase
MDLKAEQVDANSHPPLILPLADTSPSTLISSTAPVRFDVILLRPLETWAETAELPIRNISADPSFVFLWVGKGDDEGLEKGRECFAKWGYRRAEDIVWVKTNKKRRKEEVTNPEGGDEPITRPEGKGTGGGGLFASSKEHCLMGIRGTVRRSVDTRFVHCNVDTDIMVWEQDGRFCLILLLLEKIRT